MQCDSGKAESDTEKDSTGYMSGIGEYWGQAFGDMLICALLGVTHGRVFVRKTWEG